MRNRIAFLLSVARTARWTGSSRSPVSGFRRVSWPWLAMVVGTVFLSGCVLITDVDRTLIPEETIDDIPDDDTADDDTADDDAGPMLEDSGAPPDEPEEAGAPADMDAGDAGNTDAG